MNLWILRFAQYDKERQVSMTKNLSFWAFCKKGEKSTEFKTHFKIKVKNPRFKGTNLRFEFMDTSGDKHPQYDNSLIVLSFTQKTTKPSREPKGKLKKPASHAHTHKSPKFVDTSLCYAKFSMTRENKVSMTRVLSFWAFARKRKIHALKAQTLTLNSWILRCAQYDKGRQVGMTKNLSFWAFARKRKIHALKTQTRTLNLWILRFAQYDKGKQVGMTKKR